MIFSTLDHADPYVDLHPYFRETFAALKSFDVETPDGRIDLQGDDAFLLVQRYTTKPEAACTFESHREYVDIQVIFAGTETMLVEPIKRLKVMRTYDEKTDAVLYGPASGSRLVFKPRDFAVFYPQDGHQPMGQHDGPSEVLKVVAKILV